MPAPHQPKPQPEEIAARARELWLIAGSPPGGDQRFHAAAEAELLKQRETTDRAADDPAAQHPTKRRL